jgi:hypothetical protein
MTSWFNMQPRLIAVNNGLWFNFNIIRDIITLLFAKT